MKHLLVAALAVGSTTSLVDAKCAMQELIPKLLTPDQASVPADGGVLVGYDFEVVNARRSETTFKFSDGHKPVEVTKQALAPGVDVYKPKSSGLLYMTDAATDKAAGSFTRDAKASAFDPAPPATTAVRESIATGRRGKQVSIAAVLAAAPPDAAIGVILYGKDHAPLAFTTVPHDGSKELLVYRDAGRCAFNPPGMTPPPIGDAITLAWVDKFGRISKPSAPRAVAAGTVDKGD
jgi:hypothetical protein